MTKTLRTVISMLFAITIFTNCGNKISEKKRSNDIKEEIKRHTNGEISQRAFYCKDSIIGWLSEFDSLGNVVYQSKYLYNGSPKSNEHLNYREDGTIDLNRSFFLIYPNSTNDKIYVGENFHVCVSDNNIDSVFIKYEIYSKNKVVLSDSATCMNNCFYFKTADLRPGKYEVRAKVFLSNNHYKDEYEAEKGIRLEEDAVVKRGYRKRVFKTITIIDNPNDFL